MGACHCDVEGEDDTYSDVSKDFEGSLHFFNVSNEDTFILVQAVDVIVAFCFNVEYERVQDK